MLQSNAAQNEPESELVIKSLYQISTEFHLGLEHQVKQMLKLGCNRFNLDIGILSNVNQSEYKVVHQVSPDQIEIKDGDTFDFDKTYCKITLSQNNTLGVEHFRESKQYATHPAYKAFGLEAYFGTPLQVNNKTYGTLNFSSPSPSQRNFSTIDYETIRLMASWLSSELMRHQHIEQLNALNNKLLALATTDDLTNVHNRRFIQQELQRSLSLAARVFSQTSLLFIDVDLFKKINDDQGHLAGDDALIRVANNIQSQCRNSDIVGRWGGEEFAVILPTTDADGAKKVAEAIRKNIEAENILNASLTVSIGISTLLPPQVNETPQLLIERLFKQADQAVYQAKEAGRNRCVHFNTLQPK